MSVLASVPDPVEQKGFDEDVSFLIPLLRLANRVDPNLRICSRKFGGRVLKFRCR